MRAATLTLATTLALCACGQKGPLYLPDKNPAVVTRPAAPGAPVPAPASSPKKDDPDAQSPPQ